MRRIPVNLASGLQRENESSFRSDEIAATLAERQTMFQVTLAELRRDPGLIARAAEVLLATLREGRKVLVAGNGGSAAEAQHFAAELVGRFKRDREPYRVLALTTDSSIVTAVANDYGFEHVFARQVFAFGDPGDLLVAFSTSGESENLVRAAVAARQRGLTVLAVTGPRGSRLERVSDHTLRVPVPDSAMVQELHMVITHILCGVVESKLSEPGLHQ